MPATDRDLDLIAKRIRATCVQMAHDAGESHLTGALSVVDILVAFYHGAPSGDRLVFSKGHACHALYATWASAGLLPTDLLSSYGCPNSGLPIHPCRHHTGQLACSSGSLGHGLGVGVGLAYGMRLKNVRGRVIVILSDGECNEGSTWEAVACALAQQLPVVAIVDHNHLQAVASYNAVSGESSLVERFRGFGWRTAFSVCGHDVRQLTAALQTTPKDRPVAIIAKTVAGRGVSFMEHNLDWYYRSPSVDDVRRACAELGVDPLYRSTQ